MIDAEIIKALECCGEHKRLCNECSYRYTLPERCDIDMFHDAVALINRQKSEVAILIRKKDTLKDEIAEQQAEIERLKGDLAFREKQLDNLIKEMECVYNEKI